MLLRRWPIRSFLLAMVLLYGATLRVPGLGVAPLWTDEAETSINTLTILQHGVPVDRYLGIPIFENTLTSPWPDSPEYEFRDTSYSRDGLAIYHGWLPLAAAVWLCLLPFIRRRIAERVLKPFADVRVRLLLLAGWILIGFVAFNLLVPAASYFTTRVTLVLVVPSLLFGSMFFAAVSRAFSERYSVVMAPALAVVFLAAAGRVTVWQQVQGEPFLYLVIDHVRTLEFSGGTRLYADSGTNLPLRFYTGLPFQNVMPVRREFLDEYEHDLVIVEGPSKELLTWTEVHKTAVDFDYDLPEREARRIARFVNRLVLHEELDERLRNVSDHASGDMPDVADPILYAALSAEARRKTRDQLEAVVAESGNPMFDGFEVRDYRELWQVFFYRFVDPMSRIRDGLNYADRIKDCEALTLRGGWVVIECPARA